VSKVGESPYLKVPRERWIAESDHCFAIMDKYPVSPGHALVISRRPVADWWDATEDEQRDLMGLVGTVKALLEAQDPRPDGFNVGFDTGDVAGRTVDHLHIHVIPRYPGDVPDPRDGVRHVVPHRGNYLTDPCPPLRDGPLLPLGPVLADALEGLEVDRVDMAVSFVMLSGLHELESALATVLSRPTARVRLLCTDYLGITERTALERLLADMQRVGARLEVRVFQDRATSFHPKAYLLSSSTSSIAYGFVGSANLSRGGLRTGIEWTLQTSDPVQVAAMTSRFDLLWTDARARPLSAQIVADYVQAHRSHTAASEVTGELEPATSLPMPTPIQADALAALEQTRANGYAAGMVVLATGLGKTWLAAFDTLRPAFQRVLFLAHREEILHQGEAVFHRLSPQRTTGLLVGGRDESGADVVFATVQTLVRRLEDIPRDAFDYVVVDEFHHATAATYRRVLDHFQPGFLLGLTATPDRADGADLLALCDDNLVFEVGLVQGISQGALVPFHYRGIADTIDFTPIPWRNGRFDPEALEHAALAVARAVAALNEWREVAGDRTLGFCVSTRHADYMASYFREHGVSAAAVHTGSSSAPRHETLDALARGDLAVVFSVDLFNEGLDVPLVDTVLMLRPTASPVLFLQQLGRGLRTAEGKTHLTAIDFVGNHRSFLLKPRLFLALASSQRPTTGQVLRALTDGDFHLPEGCSVEYSLQALDILKELARVTTRGHTAITEAIRSWAEETGERPTAVHAYRGGWNPAAMNGQGGWFAVLDDAGVLDAPESAVAQRYGDLLRAIATEPMTKSYKMVTLRALLSAQALTKGLTIEEVAEDSRRLIARDPRLVEDVRNKEIPDPASTATAVWIAYWRRWPIAAWLGELSGSGERWFTIEDHRFRLTAEVDPADESALSVLLDELVDWRLARYLDTKTNRSGPRRLLRVTHNGRTPILMLNRGANADLPQARAVPVEVDGRTLLVDFVKIAVNVARETPDGPNVLPDLLWSWFGPDAGKPGTGHVVFIEPGEHGWRLTRTGGTPDMSGAATTA
jgi:superfamily II DNA or RNA helicase/diadenosine tetraphosphate (Ap4A) HIT family hydrolase/HKD family nuclease